MSDVVTINGVDYRPVGSDYADSPVKIVVLQRGWVMVGRWSQAGDMCSLDDAQVIRKWGTSKGLGQLINGPLPDTICDPAGHVEFHILAVVATLSASAEGWS